MTHPDDDRDQNPPWETLWFLRVLWALGDMWGWIGKWLRWRRR